MTTLLIHEVEGELAAMSGNALAFALSEAAADVEPITIETGKHLRVTVEVIDEMSAG